MSRGQKNNPICIFWFRRDLRLEDNRGLSQALASGMPVLPLFIFDPHILSKLEDRDDARVTFIWKTLAQMKVQLRDSNGDIWVDHGKPLDIFARLIQEFEVKAVYTNHDYEPYARDRDQSVDKFLKSKGVDFLSFKDQCIFEKSEVVKSDGSPYTVFTPYSRAWIKMLDTSLGEEAAQPLRHKGKWRELENQEGFHFPTLKDLGFVESKLSFPKTTVKTELIKKYDQQRNFPALDATTHFGLHLRFGTISIRKCVHVARKLNKTWLSELIWREFFMQVLWHFPHVVDKSFRPSYDQIQWRNDKKDFAAWCEGRTGYPIVDAGMNELNQTGYMHNRVRMVVASFLTKHLLIDWRWGERYFARKLLDFDLSANNGNWQWAAGTGCDAAPYFRVFNPYLQQKKFDPDEKYIRKWLQRGPDYPEPIVEHEEARRRALSVYKKGLGK